MDILIQIIFIIPLTILVFLNRLSKEEKNSKEPYILHYKNKYTSENYTPIWISVEVLPLGSISILYQYMLSQDKKKIAKEYNASKEDFESWLQNITLLRNFCAHNSIIWNKNFKPIAQKKEWNNLTYDWRRISGMIYVIKYLVHIINPSFKFKELQKIIRKHIRKYPSHLKYMGFHSKKEILELLK